MVVITPDRHSGGRGFESSSGHKKVFLPMKVSFRSCPSLAPSWLAGWSLYVQSCFIRGVKVQINFCHMVENCFVVVRLASSCFVFWIQNILATLRIVLQLGQNYSCRWVESNFVTGIRHSLPMGTKQVFFGGLRFFSSLLMLRSFRGIRVATIWYFSAYCCTNESK